MKGRKAEGSFSISHRSLGLLGPTAASETTVLQTVQFQLRVSISSKPRGNENTPDGFSIAHKISEKSFPAHPHWLHLPSNTGLRARLRRQNTMLSIFSLEIKGKTSEHSFKRSSLMSHTNSKTPGPPSRL